MISYEVLRRLMFENNVRKVDIIRATGVTRPVLVNWEHGRSEPSLETLRRLAKYFKVPITIFLQEEKNETTTRTNLSVYK